VSDRPFLDSLEIVGIKLGLDQIRALTDRLGRPQDRFHSIVVAGTNGKGSVTAMIERGLRAAGVRTGRYTSPHLVRLEERFAVDGGTASEKVVDSALARVEAASRSLTALPSYFEATTAAAFEIFRDAGVEIAVLEVGLGGRLDATNLVDPIAVAITAIDFDHQAYLGHTLQAIAREKAGVIKPGCLTVLAENPSAIRQIVEETCDRLSARLVYAPEGAAVVASISDGATDLSVRTPHRAYDAIRLRLRGRHQVDNAVTAIRLLEELRRPGGATLSAEAIRTALEDVEWPARLELIRWKGDDVLLDGAHNPGGVRMLAAYVEETYGRKLPVVAGIMRDKDIDEMIRGFARIASHFVFTAPAASRAARPDDLVRAAARVAPGIPAVTFDRPSDALKHATSLGHPVIVAGSLYLAGEIRAGIS
jgi:dihydrofolate synthase/folylpolyglutamate synthase